MAPKTKIFVGHLPDGCKSTDLQGLFEKYGTVKECDVINKYGFVHMGNSEEADAAIKALNNYNLMGSCISVEPSKSKLHPEPGAPGRAKGGPLRGMPPRNGYPGPPMPSRGGYNGGFSNGFRRFDPPFGSPLGDPYFDRPLPYSRGDRMRPYPPPYERRSPTVPMRDDQFPRRPLPPPPPPGASDMYGRPPLPPSMGPRDDLYERRPMDNRSDYLYSRRSPPPQPPSSMSHRSYWYDESIGGGDCDNRAPLPPSATRRYF